MRDEDRPREQLIMELARLRRQNAELTDQCQELERIFNNVADGIRIVDFNHNVLKINEKFAEISAIFNEHDAIGKKCYEVCKSCLCHTVACPLERIRRGETFVEIEVEKIRADGTVVPCIITATPYKDRNGKIIGILEDFKDITERKKIENEVRIVNDQLQQEIFERKYIEDILYDRRRYYEALLEALPMGVFQTDGDGLCTYFNEALSRILGQPPEKISMHGWVEFIHPDDRELALERWSRCEHEGESFNTEFRLLRPDGTVAWVTGRAVPYRSYNDKLWFVGTVADITELKTAEQALIDSKTYNELILNGVSEILILFEVAGKDRYKFIKVNNNLLNLLNLTADQVEGKTIEEVFPPQMAKKWINDHRCVIEGGQAIVFEDENEFGIFEVKLIPVYGEGGCTHLLSSVRNITEKKQLEEHLLRAEKLESLGLLAGGIAHDFNNILTAVSGNVSLARLKAENPGGKGRETLIALLKEAEKASLQARQLTRQLLTFAKGGAPITKTASIRELLRETATFALRGSNVRCRYLIPDDLWSVVIDEGQINQVIHNLVINAGHAMPGGGTISVSAENTLINSEMGLPLTKGTYVKISVHDHGVGIPKELQNKIFDPYYSTKHKGSGLGLATSYSIVNRHGGFITLDSAPGLGTTFYVYLPALTPKGTIVEDKEQQKAAAKGRVLLMDDEEMVRYVVGEILVHLGYEPARARDGAEAIEMYLEAMGAGKPFDVVIMDLTIPGGMGGKETIRQLLEVDSEVKAIVSSGYSNDQVMANYKEYGFKAVITKPFSIEELGEVLNRVLQGNEGLVYGDKLLQIS